MAIPLEQFTQRLLASGLIPDAELQALMNGLAAERKADGEQLARELVRQKKLTAYQAQEVYKGQGGNLVLGNYVVLKKLGQGGMGTVFKAEHRRMKRLVALKVLSPNVIKTPEALRRFQREVEAAARLEHPNIVTAYDSDEANGTHFLVMQYIDGKELKALVTASGPLPVEKALDYVAQAAHGLAHAHRLGIIHRDIKPANLLLDAEGTVKILDMGLARFDGQIVDQTGDDLTNSGAVMGTIDFMSPEQALDAKSAGVPADIYSLGCTLYYLLTGKPLYDGDTMMKRLVAHRESPIPVLVAARMDVPPTLPPIFERLVAKRPADRYQSMAELREKLEACRQVNAAGVSPRTAGGEAPLAPPQVAARDNLGPAIGANLPVARPTPRRIIVGPPPDRRAPLLTKDIPAINESAPPLAIAPFDPSQARRHQMAWAEYLNLPMEYTNTLGMKFVLIPPGEFDRTFRDGEELQQHVRLTKGFYLGMYEVMQREWQQVMGENPSGFAANGPGKTSVQGLDTSRFPVEMVSWNDATEFCRRLSSHDGQTYRLPFEAEWEHACRAGTTSRFYVGDLLYSDRANCNDIDFSKPLGVKGACLQRPTHVGSYLPNAFSLHDMHGNVFEWCCDWSDDYARDAVDPQGAEIGSQRVARGGSWHDSPVLAASNIRCMFEPMARSANLGFRVALQLDVGKVLVEPRPMSASAKKPAFRRETADLPSLAIAPFDAAQATRHQVVWADHLNLSGEHTNSVGMEFPKS